MLYAATLIHFTLLTSYVVFPSFVQILTGAQILWLVCLIIPFYSVSLAVLDYRFESVERQMQGNFFVLFFYFCNFIYVLLLFVFFGCFGLPFAVEKQMHVIISFIFIIFYFCFILCRLSVSLIA
jgi:hypothetical protein